MTKTFALLDDVLIERVFQPVSDLLSNGIGISRAGAACFCIDAASLAWIVSRVQGVSDAVTTWDATTAFIDTALLLLGLAALISLRTLFRRAGSRNQANPLRMKMQPHRGVLMLMLAARLLHLQPLDLSAGADVGMLLAAAAALYLGACVERPPVRYRPRVRAMMSEVETDAV